MKMSASGNSCLISGAACEYAAAASPRLNACSCAWITLCAAATSSANAGTVQLNASATSKTRTRMECSRSTLARRKQKLHLPERARKSRLAALAPLPHATRLGGCCLVRHHVEKWRVVGADIEDDDLGRLGSAAVIAGHRHLRRLDHGFAGLDRERRAAVEFKGERSFQHIDRHRKTVRVIDGLVARLENCRHDPHGLLVVRGQPLDDLLQHHVGLGDAGGPGAVLLRPGRITDAETGK